MKHDKTRNNRNTDTWLRTEREERLWQTLRNWRKERASKNNVPAYTIFADRTLQDLVRHPPATLADLNHIYGLGESKIRNFGADILALCRKWAQ